MRQPNLALCGMMGAGKTYAADYLAANHGYTKLSLATPLKGLAEVVLARKLQKGVDRELLQRFGLTGRDPAWSKVDAAITASTKNRGDVTAELVRHLLGPLKEVDDYERFVPAWRSLEVALYNSSPLLADGFGSPSYWVGLLEDKLADGRVGPGPWVIDDVRFENEAQTFQNAGFKVVLVDTPAPICAERVMNRDGNFEIKWLEDESEQAWKRIAYEEAISGTRDVGWEVAGLLQRLAGLADAA